jgi:hypothetical protein
MVTLEYIKERLTLAYNRVNVSNEEYIAKRNDWTTVDMAYSLKAGDLLGTIEALLEFMNEES